MPKSPSHHHSPGRRRLLIGAPALLVGGAVASSVALPAAADSRPTPRNEVVIECAADLFEAAR